MNIEEYRAFCLSLPAVTESFPFGEDTLVMKVKDKIFTLASLTPFSFNVKCNPEHAQELREQYSDVLPGYNMNKVHWNTILISGTIPNKQLKEWIKDSYDLIISKLPRKDQLDIQASI